MVCLSSVSESEEEGTGPIRGFGLHSTRRRVEATDSLSSDEEDDNFEMLTAENLFSTLLSRVSLQQFSIVEKYMFIKKSSCCFYH